MEVFELWDEGGDGRNAARLVLRADRRSAVFAADLPMRSNACESDRVRVPSDADGLRCEVVRF